MNNKRSEQKGVRYEDLNLPDFDLSFITPEYLGKRGVGPSLIKQDGFKNICLLHREKCECTFKSDSSFFNGLLFRNFIRHHPKSFKNTGKYIPRKTFNLNELNYDALNFTEGELIFLSKQKSNFQIPFPLTCSLNVDDVLHILRIQLNLTFNCITKLFEITSRTILTVRTLTDRGWLYTVLSHRPCDLSSHYSTVPTQQLLQKLNECYWVVQREKPITYQWYPNKHIVSDRGSVVLPDWVGHFHLHPHFYILFNSPSLPLTLSLAGFEYLNGHTINPLHLYLFSWKNPIVETAIKEGYIEAFDWRVRNPKNIIEAINIDGIDSKDMVKRYLSSKWWQNIPGDEFPFEYIKGYLEPWLALDSDLDRKFDDDWREQYDDYWNVERAKNNLKKNKILGRLKNQSIVEMKNYKDSDKKELDWFGRRMANCLTTYFDERYRIYEVTLERDVTVAIDYDVKEDRFREVKLWNNLALPTNFKKWIKKEFRKWVGVETNS